MDIIRLIDRSNKMFELLEYTGYYQDYDEVVSLKISLNNLLVSLNKDEVNFFEVLMLSSPVLFDFAFNSKLDAEGLEIRRSFERQKNYTEAKKWYKFVRNSLIHTNRYTYNNFLKSIYRIEFSETAAIYFEITPSKQYRFEEFKHNQYFIANDTCNIEQLFGDTYQIDNNARVDINYDYFNEFVLEMVSNFVRSVEHDIDSILKQEVNRWRNYYDIYKNVIDNVYFDHNIDLKLVRRLAKRLQMLKDFNLEEAYVLCEFLVYLSNIEVNLSDLEIDEITKITTFDKYYQIDDRELILNQIAEVKNYERVYVKYDEVAWILNEIYPLSSENDQSLQILEHTNYLIMYVQKYLQIKRERRNGQQSK